MRESNNTWQELRQIALLSDLPKGKCKRLLQLLIEHGPIGSKQVISGKAPNGFTVYILGLPPRTMARIKTPIKP